MQNHPNMDIPLDVPAKPSPISVLLAKVSSLGQGSKASIQLICAQSTKLTLLPALVGTPNDIQRYIDFVDNTLDLPLDNDLFRQCLRSLRKICGYTGRLPSSYYILSTEVERTPGLANVQGGHADVFTGARNGAIVAIKQLRIDVNDDEQVVKKKLCKEVVIWKRLSSMHSNILPFLGVISTYPPPMVSPWMEHGYLTQYIRANPATNRPQLLMEVCTGLQFLHSFGIVHGDLKGPNILIDEDKHVRLADFGVTSVMSHLNSLNPSSIGSRPRGTYRWMSPELLVPETANLSDNVPSLEGDIYALAIVVIELFTGNVPYPELSEPAVIYRVIQGQRPPRPVGAEALGLSETIWEVVEKCWKTERDQRPTISFVLQNLRSPGHL